MPVEGVAIDPLDSHDLDLDSCESDSFPSMETPGLKTGGSERVASIGGALWSWLGSSDDSKR